MSGAGISAHGGEEWKKTPETPVIPERLSSTPESARGLPRGLENQTPVGTSTAALLGTLEGLGISISATPEGKLRLQPFSLVPAELVEEIRNHRAELLAELSPVSETPEKLVISGHAPPAPGLPSRVAGMVSAAASGQISGSAHLPSGLVTDLGVYVLAWAAVYLTGDQVHALARLAEAQEAWTKGSR